MREFAINIVPLHTYCQSLHITGDKQIEMLDYAPTLSFLLILELPFGQGNATFLQANTGHLSCSIVTSLLI